NTVLKAASSPGTISNVGWAGVLAEQVIDDTISAITSVSAAAVLNQRGTKTEFGGRASIKIPGHLVDASDAGGWVGEGQTVRVRAQRFTTGPTLTPHKLMVITTYSNEMVNSSNIEAISK